MEGLVLSPTPAQPVGIAGRGSGRPMTCHGRIQAIRECHDCFYLLNLGGSFSVIAEGKKIGIESYHGKTSVSVLLP